MAHSYLVVRRGEAGKTTALTFVESSLNLTLHGNPDVVVQQYDLFRVEDARALSDICFASPVGRHKAVVISMSRVFHEAQNALLKLFEEPPPNTTLILVVPSEGMLLATLRSRLSPLPVQGEVSSTFSELAREFLKADSSEREKILAKLVDRSKSDKDEEKQRARSDAVRLADDLLRAAHAMHREGKNTDELVSFMKELSDFLPLLHTRSAPLKLIFEHLSLVIPKGLAKGAV